MEFPISSRAISQYKYSVNRGITTRFMIGTVGERRKWQDILSNLAGWLLYSWISWHLDLAISSLDPQKEIEWSNNSMNIGSILCIFIDVASVGGNLEGKRHKHCIIRLVGCRLEVFACCFRLKNILALTGRSKFCKSMTVAQFLAAFQQHGWRP
jgi:hypothetical protein